MFSMKRIQEKLESSENLSKKSTSKNPKPTNKNRKRKGSVSVAEPQQPMGTEDNPSSERTLVKKIKISTLAEDVQNIGTNINEHVDSPKLMASEVSAPTHKKKTTKEKVSNVFSSQVKKKKNGSIVLVCSAKLKKTKKRKVSSIVKESKINKAKKDSEQLNQQTDKLSGLKKNELDYSCQADMSFDVLDNGEERPFYKVGESENQNLGQSEVGCFYQALNMWQDSDGEDQTQSAQVETKNIGTKHKTICDRADHPQGIIKTKSNKHLLIGEVASVTATSRDTLVAAITPGSTIYIHGLVRICPLLGTAKVLGYTLQEGEMQTVYSVSSGALLGISAVSAGNMNSMDSSLQDKRIPTKWLQDVFINSDGPLLILEIQQSFPPVARFLSLVGWERLFYGREKQEPWHDISATLITQMNQNNYCLTIEDPLWHDIIDTITSCWTCGSVPRVVLCGGQGVGKSTFFKYIINSLLTNKPDSGIMCLDLDPGQSEFSLPTCLSLIRLTKPLLGPAYVHHTKSFAPYVKQVLVGATSPQFMLQRYIAAIQYLHQLSQEQPSLPLVVNTMGWTQGTGLSIMLDVLRILKPTHVIQIQSSRSRSRINFPMELHSKEVISARGGIVTQANQSELYYSLFVLPSVAKEHSTPHSFKPKVLRDLAIMAHVGQFIGKLPGSMTETNNNTSNIVKLSWTNVVLHVCNRQIPRHCILKAMNAQLVSLCHVSPDNIETVSLDHPKQLIEDSWFGEVVGWGIISSIDPLTRELTILTSLQPQQITAQVNAVIMPEMHLPDPIYKLFSPGEAPYLQHISREGAGRLKVNRQIKPRKQIQFKKNWR
ncbi:hypothetical protein OTU49_009322 [Cherax quadricarinatus]|uniref:Polynucleotide 5'-hydroxyl-kinase NOL9 n=2 Tax=Cherax quadricarinatus TaxID=27406 RepID=A0AAW0WBG1_CHEQU|nr:polynucleotide 5'-hydroxyl-kinase NOL9-like [Cherax quadricarinatus]